MPIRTCLVTGQKYEKHELLRFTIVDGQLVFDPDQKMPGRGGYVHQDVVSKLPKMRGKVAHFLKKTVREIVLPGGGVDE